MRFGRLTSALFVLFWSAVISAFITAATGVSMLYGVALTSVICFAAGVWFMSGLRGGRR